MIWVAEKYLRVGMPGSVKRARVRFAGREVEFVDRVTAIGQVEELAERGTRFPLVVYGPEGCGKTALLRQAFELLRGWGFSVVYVSPLEEEAERLVATDDLWGVVRRAWREVLGGVAHPAAPALVELGLAVASRALKGGKERIALLADDVFQAVGVDKAEQLVKTMLNLIEWPPAKYDRVVVIAASSEGTTRERIGRHLWSEMRVMWNMARDGFAQLYDLLPSPKPPLDEAWRWTGGNPRVLAMLHGAGWDVGRVVERLLQERRIVAFVASLGDAEREVLRGALEDPDTLLTRISDAPRLERGLVELNMVAEVWDRKPHLWVDVPPPKRDPELGIGQHYAWQTPLHREAVRRALMTLQ